MDVPRAAPGARAVPPPPSGAARTTAPVNAPNKVPASAKGAAPAKVVAPAKAGTPAKVVAPAKAGTPAKAAAPAKITAPAKATAPVRTAPTMGSVAAIDPDSGKLWQTVQKKTFTRWCNSFLQARSFRVVDLYADFSDGIALINLLELTTGAPIGAKYCRVPRHRAQQLENCNTALQFLKARNVKLVGIGAENIVDRNATLTLGLIWTIILHTMASGSETARNDELLKWVQATLPSHNIKNLLGDFKDGSALCALLEAVRPGTLRLPQQLSASADANVELAMGEAERICNIPRVLDVADMVAGSDDLSNRCYLSFFRDYALNRSGDRADMRPAVRVMELTRAPEPDADDERVWCVIRNKDHSYRAHIATDGTVVNAFGVTLGCLNLSGSEVASADEYFLGSVVGDQIVDDGDTVVGAIDRGTGTVELDGVTLFTINSSGFAMGHTHVHLGEFVKMGYRELTHLALYVVFLDPCFAREEDK